MSDDEDDTTCPLCVEEMDLSDKNFLPCPCGYRVILFRFLDKINLRWSLLFDIIGLYVVLASYKK